MRKRLIVLVLGTVVGMLGFWGVGGPPEARSCGSEQTSTIDPCCSLDYQVTRYWQSGYDCQYASYHWYRCDFLSCSDQYESHQCDYSCSS
jgi:hypothetical protein